MFRGNNTLSSTLKLGPDPKIFGVLVWENDSYCWNSVSLLGGPMMCVGNLEAIFLMHVSIKRIP